MFDVLEIVQYKTQVDEILVVLGWLGLAACVSLALTSMFVFTFKFFLNTTIFVFGLCGLLMFSFFAILEQNQTNANKFFQKEISEIVNIKPEHVTIDKHGEAIVWNTLKDGHYESTATFTLNDKESEVLIRFTRTVEPYHIETHIMNEELLTYVYLE